MKKYLFFIALAILSLSGCQSNKPAADSPGETVMKYYEASQKQDIATMKSLLSKSSLELIEKSAKVQGTTADELLRKEASVKIANAPVIRNEKIEGDTATVEIKNETTGEFDMKMPLVREEGIWKLARDKYVEEVLKKANEAREKIISEMANTANSNGNNRNP